MSLSTVRVAVVKSEAYADLFCCPRTADPSILTFSSRMRTGPVALYLETQCSGLIVKHDSAWSGPVVRHRVLDCNHASVDHFLNAIPGTRAKDEAFSLLGTQRDFAESVESVDWDQFDLVIALDACVPQRVTSRFPGTAWAYYIGEPCMREYMRSSRAPLQGYDVFLNLRFRNVDTSKMPPHEVDFPYYLQYPGCFRSLLGAAAQKTRTGFTLEHHSMAAIDRNVMAFLEQTGPVRPSSGTPREILGRLHASKYFLRLGGRHLWGNALIEAVSAGCLVIGDPRAFVHRDIFTALTSPQTHEQAIERIRVLEEDPALFARELSHQQRVIQYLCFDRPITELMTTLNLPGQRLK